MVNFDDLSISQARKAAAIHNLTKRAISGFFLTGAIVLAGVGSVGLYTNIERGKQVLHDFSVATTEEAKTKLMNEYSDIKQGLFLSVLITLTGVLAAYAQKGIPEAYAWFAMDFYLSKIAE